MQLKLQRSQRSGGILGNAIIFCLDVRADYAPEEVDNIHKYRLGGQIIYNSQSARKHLEHAGAHLDRTQSRDLKEQFGGLARGAVSMAMAKMSLNISIGSLARGHHIECKDLDELLEAEETVREACRSVTRYLEVASTFDGSEMVIEYDKGEERIHITQQAPPLIAYQPEEPAHSDAASPPTGSTVLQDLGPDFARLGTMIKSRWNALQKTMLAAFDERGWDFTMLHQQTLEATIARWRNFEAAVIDFAATKRLKLTETTIRAACTVLAASCMAGFLIFVFA